MLDTSTAFRTDAAWDYGIPELKGQKEKIKNSYRVAVPGCYASGFIVHVIGIPSKQSMIGDKYTFPSPILNSVMSVNHFLFGLSA